MENKTNLIFILEIEYSTQGQWGGTVYYTKVHRKAFSSHEDALKEERALLKKRSKLSISSIIIKAVELMPLSPTE